MNNQDITVELIDGVLELFDSSIAENIKKACDAIGTRKKASALLRVSQDQLQRYIRNETKPPLIFMIRLSIAIGKPLESLVYGDFKVAPLPRTAPDAPFVEERPFQAGHDFRVASPTSKYGEITDFDDFYLIPFYDVRASMGYGSWGDNEQKISDLAFRRDWIRAQGWNPEKLAVVTAVGNSMEGIIESGSPVLVDLSQPTITDAGIYVARLEDHLIIKHMQRDIDGTVYITSNNPAYREIVVSPDRLGDLHIVGRAVWSDRKL